MLPASPAAASSPAAERTLCRDRPHASTQRQALASSPGWARGPLLAPVPVPVTARRLLLVSPAPAASNLPVERMPCWDRLNAAAERQAPAAAPSPDLARGPVLALTLIPVVVAARRLPLVSPAPAASNLPAERMPCWDRLNAPAERQATVVARPSPGWAWELLLALAPVSARRQLLLSPAPAAPSLPAERTPCCDRRDAAAQRPVPAEPPLPRLVRAAAAVWEPAAARQRGPAAPNQAAARRPCSDPYDAVARQRAAARAQLLQRARLQARGWMLERAATMQARLAPARYFREQRLLA